MKQHPVDARRNKAVAHPLSRWLMTLLLATPSACAIEQARPLAWEFGIACDDHAARTEVVELQVSAGGCPVRQPLFFEATTENWRTQASRPQGIPAGVYGFQGSARAADGQLLATRCVTVEVPAVTTVVLELRDVAECPDDSAPQTDNTVDPVNTPAADAGVASDAGMAATDPEVDASSPLEASTCPEGTVMDPEGDAGCIVDECPDDPSKVRPGQCGCGIADRDGDSDGTPDCIDECPTDENKSEAGTCGCLPKTVLLPTERLFQGDSLCGPFDDSVRLTMEADGNLHLRVDGQQAWASTGPGGVFARMQTDGNLVIRDPADAATWSSNTGQNPGAVLSVHGDGTLTIATESVVHWSAP